MSKLAGWTVTVLSAHGGRSLWFRGPDRGGVGLWAGPQGLAAGFHPRPALRVSGPLGPALSRVKKVRARILKSSEMDRFSRYHRSCSMRLHNGYSPTAIDLGPAQVMPGLDTWRDM